MCVRDRPVITPCFCLGPCALPDALTSSCPSLAHSRILQTLTQAGTVPSHEGSLRRPPGPPPTPEEVSARHSVLASAEGEVG